METTNHDYSRADGFTAMAYGFYSNEGSHGMGDNANVSPSIKIGSGLGIPSPPAVAFNWQEGPGGSLGMSDADSGGEPPLRAHQTAAICIKGAAIGRKPEAGPQYGETLVEAAYTLNRVEVHGVLQPQKTKDIAGTLGGGSGQRGWRNDLDTNGAYIPESSSVVRRLTPVECCRLQGFPDAWNSEGITKDGKRIQMADAPRYRQLGNAVTVNVAHWIANNLVGVYAAAKESADA